MQNSICILLWIGGLCQTNRDGNRHHEFIHYMIQIWRFVFDYFIRDCKRGLCIFYKMEENSGQEFWITCLFRWLSLYLSGDIQSFFFDVCLSTICRSHICQVFLHGICTVLKQNTPKHNKNIRNVDNLCINWKYIFWWNI